MADKIRKVIIIEDSAEKYAAVFLELKKNGITDITHAVNAESGIEKIMEAEKRNEPFDLLLSDMHFDYFGTLDENAGEKTLACLRRCGIQIPVIFCSSKNWQIPGAAGTVFYHPDRMWEEELKNALKKLNA